MAQVSTRLTLSQEVTAADWIGERIDQSLRAVVGGFIPAGFDAYARVLHPAEAGGHPVRWAEVARRLKRELRPGDWFQDLVDSPVEIGPDFSEPRLGEIPDDVLELLLPILLQHTTSRHGWFCLWEGWAFVHGSMGTMVFRSAEAVAAGGATRLAPPTPVNNQALKAKRESWRPDYVLFEGPLEAAGELGAEVTLDPVDGDGVQDPPRTQFERQTPSLFWPDDRRWCAVNDIEASFTWIGGSAALIDALYGNADLEVTAVE